MIEFDACQPLTLQPDPTITDAQRLGIMAGLQLWNAAAGTRLALGGAAGSPTTDAAGPSVPIHFQAAAPPFHGLYEGGQVFVNDDLSGAPQAVVIAHELGHAFGLVHVPTSARTSLMNPGQSGGRADRGGHRDPGGTLGPLPLTPKPGVTPSPAPPLTSGCRRSGARTRLGA